MARRLVDHESIIEWALARGAGPARVIHTHDESDPGLRLQFTGSSANAVDEVLVPISWEEWFRTFDAFRLALVVDDRDLTWQPLANAGRPH